MDEKAIGIVVNSRIREVIRKELCVQEPLGSDYEHFQVVREIISLLHQKGLTVNDAFTILEEARKMIGYTRIR